MKNCRAIFNDPKRSARSRFGVLRVLSVLALASTTLPLDHAYAEVKCNGHRLLSMPRAETNCQTVVPQIFVTPDRASHASALQADGSLYATTDLESCVVIRSSDGKTLTWKDHTSPRGTDSHYVCKAKWSPDSQIFPLQLDLVRRPLALIISDHGVRPQQEGDRQFQRHDQRIAEPIMIVQVF